MKKKLIANLFRTLTFILTVILAGALALSLTACGGDGNGGDNNGGEGKVDPTVTWPTSLTATVGQTLADVTIPAHTGVTPGTFAWTDPTADVAANA